MRDVFINKISKYLPNSPISNDEIENYLGEINGKPSKAKRLVLRSNKIKTRYYAIDEQGITTHTNAELVAESIKLLFKNQEDIKQIEMLTAGTSSPDQFMPSHAVMVHGELPNMNSIEVMTASGNCCSGIQGMKYAYLNIATGQINNAICSGSERLSRNMRAEQFNPEIEKKEAIEKNGYIAFEKDFLRWMLSDGAASALLSNKKNENGLSFKIDFIDGISYANKIETCMYMAATKNENGDLISFKEFSPEEIQADSILSIKQDVKLLGDNILKFGMDKLQVVLKKHNINISAFDYFLPHLSSYFFEDKIYNLLNENNLEIPKEKWFTNLDKVGNVGAASPLLMLEEIFSNNTLKTGDKLLLMIPESARFSYIYMSLTVC